MLRAIRRMPEPKLHRRIVGVNEPVSGRNLIMVKAVETKTTTTATNPTTEDLSRQVDALKADISRLTETLGDFGKSKGREYQAEAKRRAYELRDEAQGHVDDLESYVRTNPAQALGIAAGIGLLIGLFSRR